MQKITQEQASRDAAALGSTAPASTAVIVQCHRHQQRQGTETEGVDVVIKTGKLRKGAVRPSFSVLQQRQMDWRWRTRHYTATLHHKAKYGHNSVPQSFHHESRGNPPLVTKYQLRADQLVSTPNIYVRVTQTVFMGSDSFSTYLQGCFEVFKNKCK